MEVKTFTALLFIGLFFFISGEEKQECKKEENKTFVVDDFPVTDEMFKKHYKGTITNGEIFSHSKVWFLNKKNDQIIVFELYTDYHRMETYLFNKNEIPKDLIGLMELHIKGGKLAPENKKEKEFKIFLSKAISISSSYFKTKKGFELGVKKEKALKFYGNPDKVTKTDGYEKLEWDFFGTYDEKKDTKGKPIAKDVFAHHVIMYFKTNKLAAMIIVNEPP